MHERPPNIRHLAAFTATVACGTLTRAAEAVNLTQPALTQAIARLESDLDCRLFEREPGGMRPTEPALLLAPHAEAALARIGSPRVTAPQMRAFLALARAGNYTAAAELTDLSPASLHRAVNDLSVALGERLVERRGRHILLTRRGEARARNFGLAMAELRSGYSEVAAWLGKAGGRIVIGAMPLSRARWLPRAILAFGKGYPNVEIAVVEGSYGELAAPLRNGDVDLLLGALRQDHALGDLAQEAVFEDRPQVIMRRGHALAAKDGLKLTDLREYEWVLPSIQTPLRDYWERLMEEDGAPAPHVAIECGSVLMIRELLIETDMLTLLSLDQLRVEINAGLLTSREPPTPVARMIGITTRRDWRPTAPQRAMLEILRKSEVYLS